MNPWPCVAPALGNLVLSQLRFKYLKYFSQPSLIYRHCHLQFKTGLLAKPSPFFHYLQGLATLYKLENKSQSCLFYDLCLSVLYFIGKSPCGETSLKVFVSLSLSLSLWMSCLHVPASLPVCLCLFLPSLNMPTCFNLVSSYMCLSLCLSTRVYLLVRQLPLSVSILACLSLSPSACLPLLTEVGIELTPRVT